MSSWRTGRAAARAAVQGGGGSSQSTAPGSRCLCTWWGLCTPQKAFKCKTQHMRHAGTGTETETITRRDPICASLSDGHRRDSQCNWEVPESTGGSVSTHHLPGHTHALHRSRQCHCGLPPTLTVGENAIKVNRDSKRLFIIPGSNSLRAGVKNVTPT